MFRKNIIKIIFYIIFIISFIFLIFIVLNNNTKNKEIDNNWELLNIQKEIYTLVDLNTLFLYENDLLEIKYWNDFFNMKYEAEYWDNYEKFKEERKKIVAEIRTKEIKEWLWMEEVNKQNYCIYNDIITKSEYLLLPWINTELNFLKEKKATEEEIAKIENIRKKFVETIHTINIICNKNYIIP